jgi:hypothetical protein
VISIAKNIYHSLHQPTIQPITRDSNQHQLTTSTTMTPLLPTPYPPNPPSTPYPPQDALAFPISDNPPRATLYSHDLTGPARLEDVPYEAQISPLLCFHCMGIAVLDACLISRCLCRSGLVDQNGGTFSCWGVGRYLETWVRKDCLDLHTVL